MRIVALNPHALSLGLTPGLTLADARARVPELVAIDHDPHADHLWLERIADGCDRWTPLVALDPPDGLTLDITGCLAVHRSEPALATDIEQRLAKAGITLRLALAGTPEAAQALARFQSLPAIDETEAIRRLPVAALRLGAEQETALHRAGLQTIAALADRPRAPLTARFGDAAMAALDRLLGRADSRISPRRVIPALQFERRFAEPIARAEDALAILDTLVHDAAQTLEERHGGGRRFVGKLYRSDGAVREITIETGLPTRDPAVPARLFRERIDALADPLDPGFGFDMIRLAVPVIEPLAAAQLRLEGGSTHEDALAALVDRLGTRLGRDRVRRFRAVDSHIPEQQTLALPAIAWPNLKPWPPAASGEPPLRPLHLFDPPQRIEVLAEVPDGPPRRFRWRRTAHDVTRYEGPERIASEWWRVGIDRLPDPDLSAARPPKPLLTRDYFRVEDVRGRRFWLFRHGLYGTETADPAWYLHGLFA
jgi:protein ImuB